MNSILSDRETSIVIVGGGNLGLSLAQLLGNNGYSVVVTGRDIARISKKLETTPPRSKQLFEIAAMENCIGAADINILTVTDSGIKQLCDSLSGEFKQESVVAHCSGALDSQILISAKESSGCSTCSIHPLNSFPTLSASFKLLSDNHHGTTIYAEGDEPALAQCQQLLSPCGFTLLTMNSQGKTLYHAASVIACNYLVSLMELSLLSAEAAGLERDNFFRSLQPLIQTTLKNIATSGTEQALSGPIARGDTKTIAKHLEHIDALNPELKHSYGDLGKHALKLVRKRNDLSPEQIEQLEKLLSS